MFPPQPGVPTLPSGFKPCGDYVAPIKLDDGTTVNVRICIYCSSNPNDRTIYTQQDCTGNYRPGQRTAAPGRPATAPQTKPLSDLGGSVSPDGSKISFTVDEEFVLSPKMFKGATGKMTVGEQDVTELLREGRPVSFPAGSKVTVSGDNPGVADLLFWNFGVGSFEAVTDFGNVIQMDVGFNPQIGVNVIVRVDGEHKPADGGMLPWRGN